MGRNARAKIEKEKLQSMVQDGMTMTAIAAAFGVHLPAVSRACKALGIAGPVRSYRGRVLDGRGTGDALLSAPPPAHAKPAPVIPPRKAELIATGGRYADLAVWAKAWGVTEIKARQEWHALRRPVEKGAVG